MTTPRCGLRIAGEVVAELYGPDGHVKSRCATTNLITQTGDQYYGDRAAGITSPPGQVTGMKLGTSSTTPAKTGSGAALGAYLSGSDHALDGGYPTSTLNGSSRRLTWRTTYAPGEATTASPVTEVALVNDTLADATSTAANTIARALLSGIGSKGVGDTLVVTWTHDLLGS
jgi:hypothetical protein